jgi:hypothetical protein
LRGPCAVGWWNGSLNPLSGRAQDLISGNDGAFYYGATNTIAPYTGSTSNSYVGSTGFYFNGTNTPAHDGYPDYASKIELADPPQLQLTNSFTIETWIKPIVQSNSAWFPERQEQIFFRGDNRACHAPYCFFLEQTGPDSFDLNLQVQSATNDTCGVILETGDQPLHADGDWHHIAAVFEVNVPWTNNPPWPTNQMRMYLDGQLLTNVFLEDPAYVQIIDTSYTGQTPFGAIDPGFSPGVTIGNRSRSDASEPYRGFLDEVTVYARALTDPEIAAIAAAGSSGKSDLPNVPPALSLAKMRVSVDGFQLGEGNGDNGHWTVQTVQFTALRTNSLLTLQSLLPGTLLDNVTLYEVPQDLYYLPEESLSALVGEDTFGVWTLQIWDSRTGLTLTNSQLVQWQVNFSLAPSNPPPVITLEHGVTYTNSIPAHSAQYFIVPVPLWATYATNFLQFAEQAHTTTPRPVRMYYNPTNYPNAADLQLLGPATPDMLTLSTNGTPKLAIGQPYYLVLTNPNPVGVTFAVQVAFDLTTLNLCQTLQSNVVGAAGIPRYFQFDVPVNPAAPGLPPQAVSFWLSGARSNLNVVFSTHLPLPTLNDFDYISQQPSTNDEIVMLVTNTTPFPIQTNRWYVGVYNTTATNVTFDAEACYKTAYPLIIPLTNAVPFEASSNINAFAVAPPGPPQWLFFDFRIPYNAPGVLFELYNLSGDADLVLQRDVPPTMAPYFDVSSYTGTNAEQIVLRTDPARHSSVYVPDLRGHWYLGVYNNEETNVAYNIRATLPDGYRLLSSARPILQTYTLLPQGLLVSWNSIIGESYFVQYSPLTDPPVWTNIGYVVATTPLSTFLAPLYASGGMIRIAQVADFRPLLKIQTATNNSVRLSWPVYFQGFSLQYKNGIMGPWANLTTAPPAPFTAFPYPPAVQETNEWAAYDIGTNSVPKFYRLFK